MNKTLCVLQITPSLPNPKHVEEFSNHPECDFYFVTHDDPHPDALKFCPGTTYVETKNILADLVPKNYDYYAFIDYDYEFESQTDLGVLDQLLKDLNYFNPPLLIPHSGNNLNHGRINHPSLDSTHFKSKTHSVQAFTHFGCKIVHKSLLDYFFPLPTNFGFAFGGCHLFNILEIPYLQYSVVTHNLIYHNSKFETGSRYEKDNHEMLKLWEWLSTDFKFTSEIEKFFNIKDPLSIKEYFVKYFIDQNIIPSPNLKNANWLDPSYIARFFDLNHPIFLRKKLFKPSLDVNPENLRTPDNPWSKISNLPPEESVFKFHHTPNAPGFYINSGKYDKDFASFIENKSIALVGPSSHIQGKNLGAKIDSHDIVIRINHSIDNTTDYGSRSDVIVNNFNPSYAPPLKQHLESLPPSEYPSYLMSSDSVAELKPGGNHNTDEDWITVDEVYEKDFKQFNIPFFNLKHDVTNNYSHRWHLYWEIFPKDHTEQFSPSSYTRYTANFNSGYGALNMILRYKIKSLYIAGVDFYNLGIPQTSRQRYNESYVKAFGDDHTSNYGPSPILHDQICQMMHLKNVLLKNKSNIELEPEFKVKLDNSDLDLRLNKYRKIPKTTRNHTR